MRQVSLAREAAGIAFYHAAGRQEIDNLNHLTFPRDNPTNNNVGQHRTWLSFLLGERGRPANAFYGASQRDKKQRSARK